MLMKKTKPKVALIGSGYWGSIIKKYISSYFELKYVADSNFDKSIIWKDEEVSAVIIATPIETHYQITKEALINDKHVLVEKPIALKYDESIELREIAKSKELKICVEYTQTFSPSIIQCVTTAKELEGPLYIEMSVKHLGRFMPCDVYWLLASHQLSILDMVCNLDEFSFYNEDHLFHNGLCTTGTVYFNNNEKKIKGRIDISTNFPGKEVMINFYGDNATIQYNPLAKNSVRTTYYDKKYKSLPSALTINEIINDYDENHNLEHSIRYFHDVMLNARKQNIDRAVRITRTLEMFAKSITL